MMPPPLFTFGSGAVALSPISVSVLLSMRCARRADDATGSSPVSGVDVSGVDVSGVDVSGVDVSGFGVSGFGAAVPQCRVSRIGCPGVGCPESSARSRVLQCGAGPSTARPMHAGSSRRTSSRGAVRGRFRTTTTVHDDGATGTSIRWPRAAQSRVFDGWRSGALLIIYATSRTRAAACFPMPIPRRE
ncbi:TonB-dependent receptor [Rhodovulum sp. PH10]|nr:TonB-dependent receptor [Rhodovulum sp. PH10]